MPDVVPDPGRRPFLARRLADEPGLLAHVEAAEKLGISLKRLSGWEPRTVYEHDDDGRIVASTPETEWDAEQRGWMLALAEYRLTRCPLCGGDVEDCGPKSRGTWQVPLPRRCWRTDVLIETQESRKKTHRPQALLWRVLKKPTGRG